MNLNLCISARVGTKGGGISALGPVLRVSRRRGFDPRRLRERTDLRGIVFGDLAFYNVFVLFLMSQGVALLRELE
jgi:hypothetical protein